MRRAERQYGKKVKQADPPLLHLYDWTQVHLAELTNRFSGLAVRLAEEAAIEAESLELTSLNQVSDLTLQEAEQPTADASEARRSRESSTNVSLVRS
ncbi:unnamed protein product, partial [Protopolystoma xenopodis]